jgi:hypothetical protein
MQGYGALGHGASTASRRGHRDGTKLARSRTEVYLPTTGHVGDSVFQRDGRSRRTTPEDTLIYVDAGQWACHDACHDAWGSTWCHMGIDTATLLPVAQ